MIIHLHKSKMFTVNPDVRFCREYGLPEGTWTEFWRRYQLLDYSVNELCDYFEIKAKRKTNERMMRRWIVRMEVYLKAQGAMKRGATTVVSSFFDTNEKDVLDEVLRNMKYSGNQNSRILA